MKGLLIILTLLLISCSEIEISSNKNGIGPVNHLELETINDSIMQVGQQLFKDKCTACHTMEYKNIGPDISDLLAVRKPEWVVNFLLNKDEMLKRDSLSIITRQKYKEGCGSPISTQKEALEILEYLRIYQLWLHEFNA